MRVSNLSNQNHKTVDIPITGITTDEKFDVIFKMMSASEVLADCICPNRRHILSSQQRAKHALFTG